MRRHGSLTDEIAAWKGKLVQVRADWTTRQVGLASLAGMVSFELDVRLTAEHPEVRRPAQDEGGDGELIWKQMVSGANWAPLLNSRRFYVLQPAASVIGPEAPSQPFMSPGGGPAAASARSRARMLRPDPFA